MTSIFPVNVVILAQLHLNVSRMNQVRYGHQSLHFHPVDQRRIKSKSNFRQDDTNMSPVNRIRHRPCARVVALRAAVSNISSFLVIVYCFSGLTHSMHFESISITQTTSCVAYCCARVTWLRWPVLNNAGREAAGGICSHVCWNTSVVDSCGRRGKVKLISSRFSSFTVDSSISAAPNAD